VLLSPVHLSTSSVVVVVAVVIFDGQKTFRRAAVWCKGMHSGITLYSGVARNSQWRGLELRRCRSVPLSPPHPSPLPSVTPSLSPYSLPYVNLPSPPSSPRITARRSGGELYLPQRVRAEPGRQTFFRAIHSPKFANPLMLLMSFDDALTRANFSFVYFLQFYLLKFFFTFFNGGV